MPVRKINFSLPALNETSAGFSSRDGFPVIKFTIGAQVGILETSSMRLTGRFSVKSDSATTVTPSSVTYTNIHLNADGGNLIQPCTKVTISPFAGVKTCIDKVVVLSKKVSKELSTDINYGQYVALRESRFGNKQDFRNSLPSRSFSLGQNAITAQRRLMISQTQTAINPKLQGQEFSIKLDIPMFQNNDLALDEGHLGGLMISIYLSPDSSFFATFMNGVATAPDADNQIDSYRYVLQDLRLEGRIQIPTQQEMTSYQNVFPMDNQINLVTDVQSSSSSNTLTPSVSQVKAFVNLFLNQTQTNNLSQSQFSFSMPPGLRSQVQAKNSVRFPLKYPVQATPNYYQSTGVDIADLTYKSLQTNIAETRLQFERSLLDGNLPAYTSADMVLTEEADRSRYLATTGAAPLTSSNLSVDSVGIGTDYTFKLQLAQNYLGSDYNLVLESGIQTGNSKLLSTYNSTSMLQQVFVRNTAFFDTINLVKSQ